MAKREPHSSIVILGAGGHGRVVADMAAFCGYAEIAFLDPGWPDRTENGVWPIIGTDDDATLHRLTASGAGFFVATGSAALRAKLSTRIAAQGGTLVSLVHPSATVSPHATLGSGVMVGAGAIVNAFARIGNGAIINTGAIVEHDCTVAAFAHIAPASALAGAVVVGEGATVGLGARVIQQITIGAGATVGAGAVVIRDVPAGQTAVGVPARGLPGRS